MHYHSIDGSESEPLLDSQVPRVNSKHKKDMPSLSRLFKKGDGSDQASTRLVYANQPQLNTQFANNEIKNSKYTKWNFIPKNLMHQFSQFINKYFLAIALLQLWAIVTPVEPLTTYGPLIFIFALSAAKEGFDDVRRHAADKRANTKEHTVVRDGRRAQVQSQDIRCGDIVFIEEDVESSGVDGLSYIVTANLDGETDLKTRQALPETYNMDEAHIMNFKGVVECAAPNSEIYVFNSRMKLDVSNDTWLALSNRQATHIRNTDWVYGLVVYTGHDTKIGKNKRPPPTKWTLVDRYINRISIGLFCTQLLIVLVLGITGSMWLEQFGMRLTYLMYPPPVGREWWSYAVIPMRFLLLMSLFIPISLKVTLDIVKYAYSLFLNWDMRMYYAETDTPAEAHCTAIAEDLGQIDYVFTDKTGTLTENLMAFKMCSISGDMYGGHGSGSSNALHDQRLLLAVNDDREDVIKFLRVLGLCHTVR